MSSTSTVTSKTERTREETRMDKLFLSVVVVSGLCTLSSVTVRRYHVVYELRNMTGAQRHCRENYMELATVRNLQDLETLTATLSSSKMPDSISRVWLGLYADKWRWSLSNTSFYKPEETEFRRWGYKAPDNHMGKELCTFITTTGLWRDYSCESNLKPVCVDVEGPDGTFVYINTSMNWTDAQSYCREHHTDLAMVRNMEDNRMVQNVVASTSWIGLFRGGWKWSDGSDSSFSNWKSGEPSGVFQDCVSADLSANGQWETLNCDVLSAFVCYRDLVPVAMRVVKMRLRKSSSPLDLNDSVVMESLLKQLTQKLKDKDGGHNDDVTLSWKKQADGEVFHQEENTRKKEGDEL